jgi:hypothetical protein
MSSNGQYDVIIGMAALSFVVLPRRPSEPTKAPPQIRESTRSEA